MCQAMWYHKRQSNMQSAQAKIRQVNRMTTDTVTVKSFGDIFLWTGANTRTQTDAFESGGRIFSEICPIFKDVLEKIK